MSAYLHGNGAYIVLEGGEGLGKTTVIKRLAEHFHAVTTREPGGTKVGAEIRHITHYSESLLADTEMLLMAADRAQLIQEFIAPQLKKGEMVISDRSWVSSLVYQGIVRGLGAERVTELNTLAIGAYTKPDLLFILHAPRDVVNARRHKEGREKDRFEQENEQFHQAVVDGFLDIALSCDAVTIDASKSPDEVFEQIKEKIQSFVDSKRYKR